MKSESTKRKERNEKKKRKLAALANLIQLNDDDHRGAKNSAELLCKESNNLKATFNTDSIEMKSKVNGNHAATADEDPDDGFIKVSRKRKRSAGDKNDKTIVSNKINIPEPSETVLSDDQYTEIKKQLKKRKRDLECIPKLRLRGPGLDASLSNPQKARTPVFLTDLQHLLMAALFGEKSPCKPDRWCELEKVQHIENSIVLVADGLSLYHYVSNESKFENVNRIFETRLEMVLPTGEKGTIIEELAQIPITNIQAEELISKYGSLENAINMVNDPTLITRTVFGIDNPTTESDSAEKSEAPATALPPNDKFPRTKLLLSALQMVDEGYPMPLSGELASRVSNFVFTKDKYAPVTEHSPMFGIDCEMCRTVLGRNELTRISIVNEKLETVYESLVMPANKIVDYLTPYSGITAEILQTVTKTLRDVHKEVRELLPPDAILVGQSLQFDLHAMQMMHPYVIDTSVCFNLSGERRRKAKLQRLAKHFLQETIQENVDGHDSVEDSAACLKLVQKKLANSIDFGDEVLLQKRRLQTIIREASGLRLENNLLAYGVTSKRRTAIVTAGNIKQRLKDLMDKAKSAAAESAQQSKDASACADGTSSLSLHEFDNNKNVVKKAREIAIDHALTIANLHFHDDDVIGERVERTVQKLDKWIGKIWKMMNPRSMLILLMGGSMECPNGVVKIAFKSRCTDDSMDSKSDPA